MAIKMTGANDTTIKDTAEDYNDIMPKSSTIDSTSKDVNNIVTTVAAVKMTSTGGLLRAIIMPRMTMPRFLHLVLIHSPRM
eukprot:13997093-Ditylum_brightwellii.AAC.1